MVRFQHLALTSEEPIARNIENPYNILYCCSADSTSAFIDFCNH